MCKCNVSDVKTAFFASVRYNKLSVKIKWVMELTKSEAYKLKMENNHV